MNQRGKPFLTRALAALLTGLLALSGLGAALAETYAVIRGTDTLNLRTDASSSSQWLGTYNRGAWVTVIGSKNNFYRVTTSDGKTGYMSKNYLSATDALSYGNVAIVNNQKATAFLNLRSYPSYASSVLTILYNGVPLNILSASNGWYEVQMGASHGYVRSEYTYKTYQPLATTVATIQTPNNTAVNMRSGPSSGAAVTRQFAGDRYVAVLCQGSHWWYVCIDGYTGFISSDFLEEGLHAARDEAAQSGGTTSGYAVVNNPVSTQKLNLRELPNTAASIVTQLSNGVQVRVLQQGVEWCRVYSPSIAATGYVMTRYLSLNNLPATPTLVITHPQGSYVNLRSAPTMTASVLAQMPNRSSAVVLTPGPDWVKVLYNGLTGYVITYFTSISEE